VVSGLDIDHGEARRPRVEPYLVPDREPLQVRIDPVQRLDLAAEKVLEGRVAVESAPVLADLGEPRPDGRRWCVDRDPRVYCHRGSG
jgi:hypothetical protein